MSLNITGYDYDNFNPEGANYPPNGEYTFTVIGEEDKQSKAGGRMITVHFETNTKHRFKIGYYIGNPEAQQAQWAFEALGRLYFAATGMRPTRAKGVVFNDIRFKPFNGTFDATPNEKGDVFPKIKNLKPISAGQAIAPAAQQPSYNNQQAAVATPSWGAPRS